MRNATLEGPGTQRTDVGWEARERDTNEGTRATLRCTALRRAATCRAMPSHAMAWRDVLCLPCLALLLFAVMCAALRCAALHCAALRCALPYGPEPTGVMLQPSPAATEKGEDA